MRWLKRLFILVVIAALAGVFWVVFAVWTGIYSVYTFPPSKTHPDGTTLIVEREQGEPMFNSPDFKAPPPPPEEKKSGMGFTTMKKKALPMGARTVLELPYVEWAYKKSLEP